MTVVGWFTIGIPAFLMSLAPNRDRARPGFVKRTLAVAVPGGLAVAAAALTTYLMTRGIDDAHDTLQLQSATATLIALIMTSTWVLSVVARPYVWWRIALVAVAYGFYFLMFTLPWSRRILSLDISDPAVVNVGIIAGACGMAVVEATWWATRRVSTVTERVSRPTI